MAELKAVATNAIDQEANELGALGLGIWNHPEIMFKEHYAHDVLTTFLEERGFSVDRKYILDTAFRASVGSKENGPHIAVLCEYDALKDIGHACGHNLIAECGVAAGLGIKAALEAAGKPLGMLSVIGTPAEEGGGGKIIMLEKGAFSDVDVAMMSHPSLYDEQDVDIAYAANGITVKYYGLASHAVIFPWEGINALDAAVQCYQAISNLRQQMKPTWKVSGVIKNGGASPNIVPEETELQFSLRAPKKKELDVLTKKVVQCFESAAVATGCKMEYDFFTRPYHNIISNESLKDLFLQNMKLLGMTNNIEHKTYAHGGSTDFGNVSFEVPSIHPFFYIGSPAFIHTREFAKATGDPKAQPYTLSQAKAMAMTAIDVLTIEGKLSEIKEGFRNDLANET